jgi:hypothetical protein
MIPDISKDLFFFYTDYKGTVVLLNIGKYNPNYKAQYARNPDTSNIFRKI